MKRIKDFFYDYKILLRSVPSAVVTFFVVSVVLMNLMANKVMFQWNDYCAGDCGVLLSWIPFLCMDIITKRFGPRAAIKINIFAVVINICAVGVFALCAKLPGEAGDYSAFNLVFECTWFILLGSMTAMLVSGIVNSVLNFFIGKMFKKNPNSFIAFISRSYVSTFIGQFVDNFLFALIVFKLIGPHYWGIEPYTLILCIGTGIFGAFIELLCEVVFSPIGYRIQKKWDKENVGKEYLEYQLAKTPMLLDNNLEDNKDE